MKYIFGKPLFLISRLLSFLFEIKHFEPGQQSDSHGKWLENCGGGVFRRRTGSSRRAPEGPEGGLPEKGPRGRRLLHLRAPPSTGIDARTAVRARHATPPRASASAPPGLR